MITTQQLAAMKLNDLRQRLTLVIGLAHKIIADAEVLEWQAEEFTGEIEVIERHLRSADEP